MTKRRYEIADRGDQPNRKRMGHIITLKKHNLPDVDISLHSVNGGWGVDHPRSGYAIGQLDQVALVGRVTLAEAKEQVLVDINSHDLHRKIAERTAELPVLNPAFN